MDTPLYTTTQASTNLWPVVKIMSQDNYKASKHALTGNVIAVRAKKCISLMVWSFKTIQHVMTSHYSSYWIIHYAYEFMHASEYRWHTTNVLLARQTEGICYVSCIAIDAHVSRFSPRYLSNKWHVFPVFNAPLAIGITYLQTLTATLR